MQRVLTNPDCLSWLSLELAQQQLILLNRIISYDILVLPQLSLIRTDNYHVWWGAHIYLSNQTEMFLLLFEPLTNGCLKSGQCEPCLLCIQWLMRYRIDLPSFQGTAVPKHLSMFYPAEIFCGFLITPTCSIFAPHHAIAFCLSCLQQLWTVFYNSQRSLKATPKGTLLRGLPNSFEINSHFWKQAKHLIQMSPLQGFYCWFLLKN